MSAVSFPLQSPSSEPATQRRRAPGGDTGRESAPFSLPDEQAAAAKPARAEDRAETRPTEAGATQKPERPGDAAAAKAQPTGAPRQRSAAPPAPGEVAATVDAQPKTDVGVLVAIVEAEQVAAGEIGEATGKPKKPEGESAPAATTDGDEAAVAMPVPLPDLSVAPQAQPAPTPAFAIDMAPSAPGGEGAPSAPAETIISTVQGVAGEGAAPEGAAAPAAGAIPGIVAAATLPAVAGRSAGETTPQPAPDTVLTTSSKPHHAVATNLSLDLAAAGGAVPDTGAGQADASGKFGEIAAHGHAKLATEASGEASATSAATTETPAEALQHQQTLPAGIDFSALVHARVAKPETLAGAGLEQSAAANGQQQAAGGEQDPTGGQPTPLHVVPLEIGLRALAGSKRFDIRLDPAELGRIDVKLDISDKGEVSAKLVVDRVETLHLLQRDARTLERAFEQAGLKPSDAGVDISLRDQGDQSAFRQNQQQDEQASQRTRAAPEAEADEAAVIAQPVPVRRLVRLGGVDLSI